MPESSAGLSPMFHQSFAPRPAWVSSMTMMFVAPVARIASITGWCWALQRAGAVAVVASWKLASGSLKRLNQT